MKNFIGGFLKLFWLFLFTGHFTLFSLQATSESSHQKNDLHHPHVKVNLLQEEKTISANHPFWVAINFAIEPEWHIYWKNPGDAGIPLKVEWTLPQGFKVNSLEWPTPQKFSLDDLIGFGYENEVILLAEIFPPQELVANAMLPLQAKISWLVCSSAACQPGETTVEIPLTVDQNDTPVKHPLNTPFFAKARSHLPEPQQGSITAMKKEGFILLQLPESNRTYADSSTKENIYFFPENQQQIDLTWPQNVILHDAKGYFLNLKVNDDGDNHTNQQLKGVLTISTSQGEHNEVKAIAIDLPIEISHDGDLSFATSIQSRNIDTTTLSTSSDHSFEGGLALALAFAFLGGVILNLMPCVLPVISFKVMSFVKMAGQNRALTFRHGLFFTFGVIASFWILASAILSLRAYGEIVGWGFQLQHPLFVVALAAILFIFSLNLFGLFEWGLLVSSWAGDRQHRHRHDSTPDSYTSSFLSGVLATAVATPCSGPFLGSAVGFALTLPSFQALLIFTALAIGLSSPYLLLAAFPSCLRFLPRPGPWMETFKQLMGFLLLATVLWLVWVFSGQTNNFSTMCLLAGLLLFSIACWIYGKGCIPSATKNKRILSFAFVLLFSFFGIQTILYPQNSWDIDDTSSKAEGQALASWQNFSPALIAQLKRDGKPFLIDFTAKWCLICQTNHLVLDSKEVAQSLNKIGAVRVKADWTKNDPMITEELRKFGRNSVPLYVYYAPGEVKGKILPQVLTPDVVLRYINNTEAKEEIALQDD